MDKRLLNPLEKQLPMMDLYTPDKRFDESNQIHETAIIHECVRLGKNNRIGAYAVIGGNGEIRGVTDFHGLVIIGDGNVISELVTIQRPATKDCATQVGNNNLIMAHVHLGHDVTVGNNTEICTGSVIGGYVTIEDGAKVKLKSVIRNRKTIGAGALVGLGSVVTKDVPKGETWFGNPAKIRALVLCVGLLFTGCSSEFKASKHNAAVMSHECVKRELKSPSSAMFIDESVVQVNDNTWMVKGFVDSENSFGGMTRGSFLCLVTYRGEMATCEDVLVF